MVTMKEGRAGGRSPGPALRLAVWIAAVLLAGCGPDGSATGQALPGVPAGGTLLLAANDGEHGTELWRTDGTAAGTAMVKDIAPGIDDGLYAGSTALHQARLDGVTYFQAWDGATGAELWKSDGTEAGTVRVKDIADAPDTTASAFPYGLVVFEGAVYFSAENLAAGRELWRTDGSEAGTVRVKDIEAGGNSDPLDLSVAGGRLWFSASTTDTGRELWVSDGTTAGTRMVADFLGIDGSVLGSGGIGGLGDGVIYNAWGPDTGTEPFYSDGSAGGTFLAEDIWLGGGNSFAGPFVSLGSRVLFQASDGAAAVGTELWVAQKTPEGLSVTPIDIVPGTGSSWPYGLTPFNGAVYFGASGAGTGTELWRSDGTPAGTVPLEDLIGGIAGSFPAGLTPAGDRLYFFASVGGTSGLWRTDGSVGGAVKVADLPSGCHQPIGTIGTHLVFGVDDDGDGYAEPWVSDGTPGGTFRLVDADAFSCGEV